VGLACCHSLSCVEARPRPDAGCWLRPEIAACHSADPFALGPCQRLARLSGLPEWVTPQEHQFIRPGGQGQFGKSFSGIRYEEHGFEGGPYLGFPTSHDVYGDGSIVVVPAPGHTPGGVIIFVTLAIGTRYAFVGDLVWQLEGLTLREERPWITRRGSDSDAEGNRENLLRMIALKERLPESIIVPAHDMRPFAEMPALNSGKQ